MVFLIISGSASQSSLDTVMFSDCSCQYLLPLRLTFVFRNIWSYNSMGMFRGSMGPSSMIKSSWIPQRQIRLWLTLGTSEIMTSVPLVTVSNEFGCVENQPAWLLAMTTGWRSSSISRISFLNCRLSLQEGFYFTNFSILSCFGWTEIFGWPTFGLMAPDR